MQAPQPEIQRPAHPQERGPRVFVMPALLLGVIMACEGSCCEDPVLIAEDAGPVAQCNLQQECGAANLDYRFGECRLSGCEADSDCCPGSRCRLDVNACVPYLLDPEYACDNDGDCDDPATRCQAVTLGEREPVNVCAYERCLGDSDCGIGRSCFQSICVQSTPCDGGCPSGQVCDVITGQCAEVPPESMGCDKDCGESGMLVLTDPDQMSGERCCALECECRVKPPILATRFGRYASVAVTQSEVLVSAYEADYGDLVVAHFTLDGQFSRVEFVDGLPEAGAVVADPTGPRGGVSDVGPDVGTHTSIAVTSEGLARIAYHDVENRSLKVAIQTASGWDIQTLDVPTGDGTIGLFTDIALDPDSGRIDISYMAQDALGAPGLTGPGSGAKLARSSISSPASASDWEIRWVDARPPYDPCSGNCGDAERCVIRNTVPECLEASSACSPACGESSECVTNGSTPACRATATPPSISDLPKARGLHTQLILNGSETVMVYYDSIDGDVRLSRIDGGGATRTVVVDGDGNDGRRSGDVGRFPTLVRIAGDFLVIYTDFTRHELVTWRGTSPGMGGSFGVVDNGKVAGEPGKRFVGAGASASLAPNGQPLVVYQDASNLDLKISRFNGSDWAAERVLENGAHGFYSDVFVQEGQAFMVSLMAELDPRGRERSRAAVTVYSLP